MNAQPAQTAGRCDTHRHVSCIDTVSTAASAVCDHNEYMLDRIEALHRQERADYYESQY